MLRETLRRRKAEPTFWGDLDVETGDCGLMLLAEEPADRDKRGGGVLEKRANSNEATVFSPVR